MENTVQTEKVITSSEVSKVETRPAKHETSVTFGKGCPPGKVEVTKKMQNSSDLCKSKNGDES